MHPLIKKGVGESAPCMNVCQKMKILANCQWLVTCQPFLTLSLTNPPRNRKRKKWAFEDLKNSVWGSRNHLLELENPAIPCRRIKPSPRINTGGEVHDQTLFNWLGIFSVCHIKIPSRAVSCQCGFAAYAVCTSWLKPPPLGSQATSKLSQQKTRTCPSNSLRFGPFQPRLHPPQCHSTFDQSSQQLSFRSTYYSCIVLMRLD